MGIKIIIISYGLREYDGRLHEIIKSCKNVGDTQVICLSTSRKDNSIDKNEYYVYQNNRKYLGFSLYLSFFIAAIRMIIKESKSLPIIFIDNFYSAPIGMLIKFLWPKLFIIQDCRELYFKENMPGLGKIFCFFEEKLMKKANLVFCANKYRSNIMKEKFSLDVSPSVYDNVRFLTKTTNISYLDEKYNYLFKRKWSIISTGGYSIGRRTDKLISEFMKLDSCDFELLILGSGPTEDRKKIENMIGSASNIYLLGKVDINELAYFVSKSSIGVVSYNQNDLNNEYCSSGKLYEYLGEGIPVVTTENLPLKEFCDINKIGISNNQFQIGILEVTQNYDVYKKSVEKFMNKFDLESNNKSMEVAIKKSLRDGGVLN